MADKKQLTGNIFDIQGLSVHDGPGCRTVIFLKGCSMQCSWCSNPEGINPFIEPLYYSDKCIHDGNCIVACKKEAISINAENELDILKSSCKDCVDYSCTDACLTNALKKSSSNLAIDEVFQIIQRDRKFWGQNGGVTLSGGEPLLQAEFATELLKKCYDAYIHTAIETCGNVNWEYFKNAIPYLNWIFFDLKQMNSFKHSEETKVNNKLILSNAKKLAKIFTGRLIFRIPIIPGFNDSEKNLKQVADFIKQVARNEINILPLHHLGREKYTMLNKKYHALKFPVPAKNNLENVKKFFESQSLTCYIGSVTPF